MKKWMKNLYAMLLVVVLIATMIPTSVMAAPGKGSGKSKGKAKKQAVMVETAEEETVAAEELEAEPAPVEEETSVEEPADEMVEEVSEETEASFDEENPVPEEEIIVEEISDEEILEAEITEDLTEQVNEDFLPISITDMPVEDLLVSIDAPEGAFPTGTEVFAKSVPVETVQESVDSTKGVEGTVLAAVDITFIYNGEELQPQDNLPVNVSITAKNLIADVNAEELSVVHIDSESDKAETIDSEVDETAEMINFESDSFSTFAIVWYYGYREVTVHHGIMQNGYFVEFGTNGLPSSSNSVYPTDGLDIDDYGTNDNNRYAYLIYDFPGYTYSETYYRTNESSTPASGGTSIKPVLRNENGYTWNYRRTDSFNRDVANNSHIYVIYTPKVVSQGADGSGSGDETDPDKFTPDVGKTVSDQKADGTYDITLGFVGDKQPAAYVKARVIVVFDRSGSMSSAVSTTDSTVRLTAAKNAVNAMAEKLLGLTDANGNKLVEMGLVSFGTNAQIETFGNNVQFTSNYNTGSGGDRFKAKVDGFTTNNLMGGTNWEKALDLANSMAAASDAKTYIVFISDGDPTFRTSRGNYLDYTSGNVYGIAAETLDASDYYGNTYPDYFFYSDNVFGYGTNDRDTNNRCYNAAKLVGDSIVAAKKSFFTVGLSSDATRMSNLASETGGTFYDGSNAETFANNMAEIAGKIAEDIGLSEVTITDGVTDMSHIQTDALIGTAGDFTYYKSYPLTAEGSSYTYKIGDTSYTVTQAQVDSGSDGNGHRIYSRTTSAGTAVFYIEYPWEDAPEASVDEHNSVIWDTSSANDELEHGVYYSVTFTVWPKQEAYDLIADLNNELKHITELDSGVKVQLRVLVNGTTYEFDTTAGTWTGGLSDAQLQALIDSNGATYSMKTNTGLSADYEYAGVPGTANYTNYTNGNMTLDTTTFSIHKNWVNQLPQDSRTAQVLTKMGEDGKYYLVDADGEWILDDGGNKIEFDSNNPSSWKDKAVYYIDIIVTKDNNEYEEVRLLSSENWRKDDIFISLGVISENSDGTLVIRETGHEYSVTEKPSDAYYWELTAYTYRPMVINKVTTMLQKIDETDPNYSAANAKADNTVSTISGTKYYKFGGGIYKAIAADEALLEATNNRRSYLNLTKEVEGTDTPADAMFEYTVKITDPNKADFWFSAYDPEKENADGTKGGTVLDWTVTEATAEAGNTGYWYAASGSTVTFKIEAGWNVRFTNLMSTTTYEITEITDSMEEGFIFDAIEATAELDGAAQTYEPTIADEKIIGEIKNPNTDYTVTYSNKYLGVFYVYHSSDNTVERFPMAVNGVQVTDFDIFALTAEYTLYGGYYDGYAGKSEGFDATAAAKLDYSGTTNPKDEGGTAYSYAYIKSSGKAAWNDATPYTDSGKTMDPVSNTVYYLKEVPTGYLQPYNYYTYFKADNTIADMWAISGLDDLNYKDAGFYIQDVYTKTTNVVSTLSIKAANSSTTVKLTAYKTFFSQGVKDGYLSYAKISDSIGTKVLIQQFWKTPDDIEVFGTMQREVDTSSKKKGEIIYSLSPCEK